MSTYTETESRTGYVQNRALPRVQVRLSVPQIPVLCADLDGTLIKSDLLWECILVLLKTAPWLLLLIPFWLSKGVANLKRELAERAVLKPTSLSFRSEVVEFLQTERGSGRVIVLAIISGYSMKYAQVTAKRTCEERRRQSG